MDYREQQYRSLLRQRLAGQAQAVLGCVVATIILALGIVSVILGKATIKQALIPFGATCFFLFFAAVMNSVGRDLSRLAKHHRPPPPKDFDKF